MNNNMNNLEVNYKNAANFKYYAYAVHILSLIAKF